MPTTKELAAELDALRDACRRLAAHAEVVAVAVRSPEAVPADDLAAALAGLREVGRQLGERRPA